MENSTDQPRNHLLEVKKFRDEMRTAKSQAVRHLNDIKINRKKKGTLGILIKTE